MREGQGVREGRVRLGWAGVLCPTQPQSALLPSIMGMGMAALARHWWARHLSPDLVPPTTAHASSSVGERVRRCIIFVCVLTCARRLIQWLSSSRRWPQLWRQRASQSSGPWRPHTKTSLAQVRLQPCCVSAHAWLEIEMLFLATPQELPYTTSCTHLDLCASEVTQSLCVLTCLPPAVPGFEVAVRKYILHVFGITYQRVNKKVLGEALQLQGAALDTLVSGN